MSANHDQQMASMFGYKSQQQQQKWAQRRQARTERVSAAKSLMSSAGESLLQFSSRNIDAQLNAAHRVSAQREFEETHTRNVSRTRSGVDRSITETVSYSPKDDRTTLDADLEF